MSDGFPELTPLQVEALRWLAGDPGFEKPSKRVLGRMRALALATPPTPPKGRSILTARGHQLWEEMGFDPDRQWAKGATAALADVIRRREAEE